MTVKMTLQYGAAFALLFAMLSTGASQEIATQPPPIETMADLESLFAGEPSYGAIQQVAMRYAEVHPDKIAAWRRGASLRAFLPQVKFYYAVSNRSSSADEVDIGYSSDYGYSNSAESSERTDSGYHNQYGESYDNEEHEGWSMKDEYTSRSQYTDSSSTGYYQSSGDFQKYSTSTGDSKETNWGVYLQWDLRDFIFNRDQTRISKEARDLVELRQDVLEQVNTYFFDRRRAEIEMIFSPPSDVRSKIDLQLRIARLTANIDALTGGFLSKSLNK